MYIHIPDHMIEAEHSDCEITKTKTHETTNKMLENYHWLKSQHEKYAELCGADYKLFEFDDDFNENGRFKLSILIFEISNLEFLNLAI